MVGILPGAALGSIDSFLAGAGYPLNLVVDLGLHLLERVVLAAVGGAQFRCLRWLQHGRRAGGAALRRPQDLTACLFLVAPVFHDLCGLAVQRLVTVDSAECHHAARPRFYGVGRL